MNLIIDIGNTRAKLVAFDGETPVEEMRTGNKTLVALPDMLAKYSFSKAIVATVANLPAATELLLRSLPFPTLRLTPETPVPDAQILYRTPQTLGADRIGAVVGAVSLMPGRDLLIIDGGTCVTYEFVDSGGRYWGGNISPGLHMRLEALREKTDRLPKVEMEGDVPPMGYDTETAIRSGVVRGIKYEIEGYIAAFRQKYPALAVIFTGGEHFDFDSPTKSVIFADKYLVARGLNRILEYNT
ncbi:MAG: type III pantothenate kinase [Prevotellaceae bacterium]|nr:type III pantothenate kinase [Prevotellaceae bacterium]